MPERHREIDTWRELIDLGIEYREKYGFSKQWPKYRKYYRNEYKSSVLPVNMIFAIARSLLPRVYFRNPRTLVSPTRPGMDMMAEVVENTDNWLLHRIGIKKEMKSAILDTFLCGTAIVKTGYDSEYGYVSKDVAREHTELEQQYIKDKYINPFDNNIEYNTNILPGMPWAKRVHPSDFIIPWGYTEIHNSPWVVHHFMRHIDDVKADEKYENTDDLKATHRVLKMGTDKNNRLSERPTKRSEETEYVELWEISDLRDGRVKVLATGHNRWLRNEDDPLLISGHKYFDLRWNEDPKSFWAVPDAKIIEPQQLELNEIRTQYREHRKIAILKLIVAKGAIEPEQMDKLLNGDIGAVVEVADDIGRVIKELQPYLSNDLLVASQEIRKDIREQVGFSRNAMGEFDTSSRRTATEAEIVARASQIRVDERRDMAADMLVNIVQRLNQYIFKFWDTEKVTRVIGPEGASTWVSFTGAQIRGDYDLRVDPDTARARSSERRRYEAKELLSLLAQFYEFAPERINLGEALKYVVSQYEGINVNKLLNMQSTQGSQMAPVPLQQAMLQSQQQQGAQGQAQPQMMSLLQALEEQQ